MLAACRLRAASLATALAMDAAMTRFLLRKSELDVRLVTSAVYVRCALARTGSLQTVCARSSRSAAWRFGSPGTGAHRRPRGRCAVGALLAACEEVAAKAACKDAKCDQCGCGSSATGDRFEQTSCDLCAWFRSVRFSLQCGGALIAPHCLPKHVASEALCLLTCAGYRARG